MLNATTRHSPRLLLAAAAFAAIAPSAAHAQPVRQPGPGEAGWCDVIQMNTSIWNATGRAARNNGHVGECDPATYGMSEDELWTVDQAVIARDQQKVDAYFGRQRPAPAPAQPAPSAPAAAPTDAPTPAAPVAQQSECPDLAAVASGDPSVSDDGVDGPPSEAVIRQVIQAEFVIDYVKPITCLGPVAEVGRIQVGAPTDRLLHLFDLSPTQAYPVKARVKISIFNGDTYLRSYQRGVNGEIFFLYRDDFGAWRLVTGQG